LIKKHYVTIDSNYVISKGILLFTFVVHNEYRIGHLLLINFEN